MKLDITAEIGYFTYTAYFGGNPTKAVPSVLTTKTRFNINGYYFYVNTFKDPYNQYGVTEEQTGRTILTCATDDVFIIKQRLKEFLVPNWQKFLNAVEVMNVHTKPNLLFTMLLL